MRITNHPLLTFERGKKIHFTFNGKTIEAYEGETIAAALHADGIKVLKTSINERPRGFFCVIGKCASCMMNVNGVPNVKTCVTLAEDGMAVKSQSGRGVLKVTEGPKKSLIRRMKTQIAVIGAGPAGLTAAVTAHMYGASVLVIDENPHAGGQLIKQTHKFFGSSREKAGTRGTQIARDLYEKAQDMLMLNAAVVGYYGDGGHVLSLARERTLIELEAERIIVAPGASEKMLLFENNDLPGVYGAGAVQTLMNVELDQLPAGEEVAALVKYSGHAA